MPNTNDGDTSPMTLALEEAERAYALGEVPVGAVIVRGQTIIARAHNRIVLDRDPTAHAEILAIRAAGRLLGSERLVGCDLYVTLEPCAMCAAAISFARLRRLYWGCIDPKGGAVESGGRFFTQPTCHHAPDWYGAIAETPARDLLRRFFSERRGSPKVRAETRRLPASPQGSGEPPDQVPDRQ